MDCCCNTLLSQWEFRSLSPRKASCNRVALTNPNHVFNSKVHAGSFRVFAIHRTLTWTTGSLTCVLDYSYACVYTQGVGHLIILMRAYRCVCALGTPTASRTHILSGKDTKDSKAVLPVRPTGRVEVMFPELCDRQAALRSGFLSCVTDRPR